MIDILPVQDALITLLKSATTITAIVGPDEIRERMWQSKDAIYPNVRLHVSTAQKVTTGNCSELWARINCVLLCSSELPSSRQSITLADAVSDFLRGTSKQGRQFKGTNFHSEHINVNLYSGPTLSRRIWRTDLRFTTIIHQHS